MKKYSAILCLILTLLLCGCNTQPQDPYLTPLEPSAKKSVTLSNFDQNTVWDPLEATKITLKNGETEIRGIGAKTEGDTVLIHQEGDYLLEGALSNGQIIVTVEKTEKVHLILNGISVTNQTTAPLYISEADKVCITLVKDTENTLIATGASLSDPIADRNNNINACLYAAADLTVNGEGGLRIEGSNNGIGCKNDVRIVGGNLEITAKSNGIKGKNSIAVTGGSLTVKAGKDGLKATNQTEPEKGFVYISGGITEIQAKDDGIQAITNITVCGGKLTVYSVDKKFNCDGTQDLDMECIQKTEFLDPSKAQ